MLIHLKFKIVLWVNQKWLQNASVNCWIFPVVSYYEYLVWILDDSLFSASLFCRMWMVSSTTPRTATAHRSAFASPLSAGVVKVTKALRGFDTTPSTSTRPSLPTSSARCSSRECQHHTHACKIQNASTHMYIQYKLNSSTSIHTSSYGWSVLSSDFWRTSKKYLSGGHFCLYFTLLRVRLHFFPFHSTPHEEETLIFLYSSSWRKTPWIPVSFCTSMRRIWFNHPSKHYTPNCMLYFILFVVHFVLFLLLIIRVHSFVFLHIRYSSFYVPCLIFYARCLL